jgi:hypothetical protein
VGPVEFNEIVRVADDVLRVGLDPLESWLGRHGLQAHDATVALDLDRLAGGQNLIEDRVDIRAELRGGDLHAWSLASIAYVRNRTYGCQTRRAVLSWNCPHPEYGTLSRARHQQKRKRPIVHRWAFPGVARAAA